MRAAALPVKGRSGKHCGSHGEQALHYVQQQRKVKQHGGKSNPNREQALHFVQQWEKVNEESSVMCCLVRVTWRASIVYNSGEKSNNTVEKSNPNVESSVSHIESNLSSHFEQHWRKVKKNEESSAGHI